MDLVKGTAHVSWCEVDFLIGQEILFFYFISSRLFKNTKYLQSIDSKRLSFPLHCEFCAAIETHKDKAGYQQDFMKRAAIEV